MPSTEMPGSPASRFLRRNGYIAQVAGGNAWILKSPDREDVRELCLANYWPIVRLMLDQYQPAVVERLAAARLYLEEYSAPELLTVRHNSNQSRYTVEVCEGLLIRLTPGSVDHERMITRQALGVDIPVDTPEETLLRLTATDLRENLDQIASWLRTLVLSRPSLEAAYAHEPHPVVVKRLSQIARELQNDRLADQLEALLAAEYPHRIGRGKTGVGKGLSVPQYIIKLPPAGTAWQERHAATYAHFRDVIGGLIARLEREAHRASTATLLEQAREAKTYDAYHSTTIEGYRISPEEVSAVLRNRPVAGQAPEQVRARMAIAGYGHAFERCLRILRDASGSVPISEILIADLHADLFAPSVEAGIVSAEELRGYRREPAYLRGSRYVPPGPDKVPALMVQYSELTNAVVGRPILRAILAHLDFVTIHPFADGNGRLARFLMNLALVGEGLPWVTLRAEDRFEYFHSLEAAQVGEDPIPFARFLLTYVEQATSIESTGRSAERRSRSRERPRTARAP
jgi:Fic family protein